MHTPFGTVVFDPAKAASNRRKHGVTFADAEDALHDPFALTIGDPDLDDEPRFVTVGTDGSNRVLVVVYVLRDDNVRLISARKATPGEAALYHAQAL